jgi:hypothetical protein
MFEETCDPQSCFASPEEQPLLNPHRPSEPASSAILLYNTFQAHTANQTACKQSLQQSQKLGEDINEPTASALSLVLENKGSVARDHLASERTYLAYVRTSLACANAGVGELMYLLAHDNHLHTG